MRAMEWIFMPKDAVKISEFKINFLNETYTRRHLQVTVFKFSTEWMAVGSQQKS
jgi:hypothetical protein